MSPLVLLLIRLLLGNIAINPTRAELAECQQHCGNVEVPYPFGVGGKQCAYQEAFELVCEKNPPILTFARSQGGVKIKNINVTERTMNVILSTGVLCLDDKVEGRFSLESFDIDPLFTMSSSHNKFVAIGCNFSASITSPDIRGFTSGCRTSCGENGTRLGLGCRGNGCCQTIIPEARKSYSWLDMKCVIGILL